MEAIFTLMPSCNCPGANARRKCIGVLTHPDLAALVDPLCYAKEGKLQFSLLMPSIISLHPLPLQLLPTSTTITTQSPIFAP